MTASLFDTSFFGYTDLPGSLELNDRKLVPVKFLKLKYEDNSMTGGFFSVWGIKSICNSLKIELHRPVKGLYCIEESYVRFFDHLHYLLTNGFISDGYKDRDLISNLFESFYI
jgi:hypothetical protein